MKSFANRIPGEDVLSWDGAGNLMALKTESRTRMTRILVWAGFLALCFFAAAPELRAQGCAMCYQNAAATGPQGTEALRHAILVLIIPPVAMFSAILGLLYQRRNASR